jgi:hypothetical protein
MSRWSRQADRLWSSDRLKSCARRSRVAAVPPSASRSRWTRWSPPRCSRIRRYIAPGARIVRCC